MNQTNSPSDNISNTEIKALLEENLKEAAEIKAMVKSIKIYTTWQKFFSVLKIIIILVPIVFGMIYLQPLISKWSAFLEMLNPSTNQLEGNFDAWLKNLDPAKLPARLKN